MVKRLLRFLFKGSREVSLDYTPMNLKIMRCAIVALSFLGITTIVGMGTRNAHQFLLMLGVIILFGLLLKNLWLTLFLWWTCFLFTFFKFTTGSIYVQNIFTGCVLFYLVKVSFRKQHVSFFLNAFLWFVVINIFYMALQLFDFDFIYIQEVFKKGISHSEINKLPIGFMGFTAGMGMLMAFAVPILASRRSIWAKIGSFGLFIPLWLSQSSANVIAGLIGLLFVFFFNISRWKWIALIALVLSAGTFYTLKVDRPNPERIPQWKMVLRDAIIHPLTGWGLDSFAHYTERKGHVYSTQEYADEKRILLRVWDNPHSLYVSLFYEWGFLGLFFLGGYLRQSGIRFQKAIKSPNTIALAGFMLVFLVLSGAHFPIFLARLAVIIISVAALYEVSTD